MFNIPCLTKNNTRYVKNQTNKRCILTHVKNCNLDHLLPRNPSDEANRRQLLATQSDRQRPGKPEQRSEKARGWLQRGSA